MAFLRRRWTKNKQQDQEHITQVVLDYVLASWDRDLVQILEDHRDVLLSDAADKVLDRLEKESVGDKKLSLHIQERRALLVRCLVDGVELACAYYLRLNNPDALDLIMWKRLEEKESGLREYMSQRPELLLASALNYIAQASTYYEEAGEDKNNLVKAIVYYYKALDLLDPETFPEEWGEACFQIARVYMKESSSDWGIARWAIMDRAIVLLGCALIGWTRDVFPFQWARAQLRMGLAYSNRLRGDFWDNTEQAIRHFKNASQVITRATSPEDWWLLYASLGHAYLERNEGDQKENIEKAIARLQNALSVCGSAEFRERWITTQFFLGQAFLKRIHGERADNIEQAIHCFQVAIKDRNREIDPLFWMEAQTGLGDAYASRVLGLRAENLALAAAAYQHAIQGQRLEDVPERYLVTRYQLGDLKFMQQDWDEACTAYQTAIIAMELLYQAGGTTEARQSWLRGRYDLHAKAAYCLAKLGRFNEAVTLIESGKARALGEALARDVAALDLASDQDRAAFTAARQHIAALEAQARMPFVNQTDFWIEDLDSLDSATARKWIAAIKNEVDADEDTTPDGLALENELSEARDELEEITARIQGYAPEFTQERSAFAEIAKIAGIADCPLVYLLTTPAGSLAMIVVPGIQTLTEEYVVWLHHFQESDLEQSLFYQTGDQPYYLDAIAGSETVMALKQVLDKIWPALDSLLVAPVVRRLTELGYPRAVLLADAFLGLFPLPAIALDQVTFACTPSARTLRLVLKNAKLRARLPEFLLGIGNPLPNPQPLPFAPIEIEGIGSLFAAGERQLLFEYQATRENVLRGLSRATHLHFSCHGYWNAATTLDSAFSLSGNEMITLRDLLDGSLDLQASRLAVLSACQTGLMDVLRVPGEFLGLPAGFLQAGVPGVVGSLWPVNDLSTALLMIKFYEYHLRGEAGTDDVPMMPASALRRAQIWLRDVTNDVLAELFDQYRKSSSSPHLVAIAKEQFEKYVQRDPDERPFAHPFYWAAFAFYGV